MDETVLTIWVPSRVWRLGGDGKKCRAHGGGRMRACRRPAVASLLRGKQRWYYCEQHLYGARLENGVILAERYRCKCGHAVHFEGDQKCPILGCGCVTSRVATA